MRPTTGKIPMTAHPNITHFILLALSALPYRARRARRRTAANIGFIRYWISQKRLPLLCSAKYSPSPARRSLLALVVL